MQDNFYRKSTLEDKGWAKMDSLLNDKMPVRRSRRIGILWFTVAASILLSVGLGYLRYQSVDKIIVEGKHSVDVQAPSLNLNPNSSDAQSPNLSNTPLDKGQRDEIFNSSLNSKENELQSHLSNSPRTSRNYVQENATIKTYDQNTDLVTLKELIEPQVHSIDLSKEATGLDLKSSEVPGLLLRSISLVRSTEKENFGSNMSKMNLKYQNPIRTNDHPQAQTDKLSTRKPKLVLGANALVDFGQKDNLGFGFRAGLTNNLTSKWIYQISAGYLMHKIDQTEELSNSEIRVLNQASYLSFPIELKYTILKKVTLGIGVDPSYLMNALGYEQSSMIPKKGPTQSLSLEKYDRIRVNPGITLGYILNKHWMIQGGHWFDTRGKNPFYPSLFKGKTGIDIYYQF